MLRVVSLKPSTICVVNRGAIIGSTINCRKFGSLAAEHEIPVLSVRPTDPAAAYHPDFTSPAKDIRAVVVRMAGELKDGSVVYEHIPVTVRSSPVAEAKQHQKLSEADIAEIQKLRSEDPVTWTQRKLALMFGVSRQMVIVCLGFATFIFSCFFFSIQTHYPHRCTLMFRNRNCVIDFTHFVFLNEMRECHIEPISDRSSCSPADLEEIAARAGDGRDQTKA